MKTPQPRVYMAALARLIKGRGLYQWEVRRCAICTKGHLHGGGSVSEDPRAYLSHRVAHCMQQNMPSVAMVAAASTFNCSLDGYILVDEKPHDTDAMLRTQDRGDA
jgi:hypothetical protein